MRQLVHLIDGLNDRVGKALAWLALAMVLVQFGVVVLRYVFGIGEIAMQESIVYMHGLLFLLGSGYTLLHGGHVRVDIFYRDAAPRTKAVVDLLGAALLLLPVIGLIAWVSYPYVTSSWAVFEGSKETSGIQAVFLLKTAILVFAGLMALQGLAVILRAVLVLSGRAAPPDEEAHDNL